MHKGNVFTNLVITVTDQSSLNSEEYLH